MEQLQENRVRSLWILPHRDQSGDEVVVEDGQRKLLTEAVRVVDLPREIVLGVPEELIRRYGHEGVIFAQLSHQAARSVFALSVPTGRDKGGRIVHLTLLQVLPHRGEPDLFPPSDGLPDLERKAVGELAARFRQPDDRWCQTVWRMLDEVKCNNAAMSFANIVLKQAVYKPDWPRPRGGAAWMGLGVVLLGIVVTTVSCYSLRH